MNTIKSQNDEYDDDEKMLSIEEFEERKLSIWTKIIIWFVIFTLTFWSVAWFY